MTPERSPTDITDIPADPTDALRRYIELWADAPLDEYWAALEALAVLGRQLAEAKNDAEYRARYRDALLQRAKQLVEARRQLAEKDEALRRIEHVCIHEPDAVEAATKASHLAREELRAEPAQEPRTLVYCTACCKTHAVTADEAPCEGGQWLDPRAEPAKATG